MSKTLERLRSIRKIVLRALQRLKIRGREAPLFVVTFPVVAGYSLPKEFDQGDFAGLEFLALLEKKCDLGRIFMLWADCSFYYPARQRLGLALSCDIKQAEIFYVTDGRQQESSPRFWAKIAVVLVALGTLATFCVNLKEIGEAFGTLYEHIFAEPNVELLAIDEPSINAVEGEKRIIDLECRNLAAVPCELQLDPVVLEAQELSRIFYNSKTRLPEIGVGESKKFSIALMPKGVRDHIFTILGSERAGILHGDVKIKPKTLSVKVWAPIDNAPAVALSKQLGTTAEFAVIAKHGRPPNAGVVYDATLVPADDIKFVGVSAYRSLNRASGNVSAIEWQDNKPEAFKNRRYILFLKGDKARDEKEWSDIASSITVSVGEIK